MHDYIGDGVYVQSEDDVIILKTQRQTNGLNWIHLEPDTFWSLLRFAERFYRVKIKIENAIEEKEK